MPEKVVNSSNQLDQLGFTLLESIIVITIITILTFLTASALPLARSNQALRNDVNQLRSLLSNAQQRALNEIRDEECISQVGGIPENQILCSTVGVALQNKQAITFADIDGDWLYTDLIDYKISEVELSSTTGEVPKAIVFQAIPPSVYMIADGDPISPTGSTFVTLESGRLSRTLEIKPFGLVELLE